MVLFWTSFLKVIKWPKNHRFWWFLTQKGRFFDKKAQKWPKTLVLEHIWVFWNQKQLFEFLQKRQKSLLMRPMIFCVFCKTKGYPLVRTPFRSGLRVRRALMRPMILAKMVTFWRISGNQGQKTLKKHQKMTIFRCFSGFLINNRYKMNKMTFFDVFWSHFSSIFDPKNSFFFEVSFWSFFDVFWR